MVLSKTIYFPDSAELCLDRVRANLLGSLASAWATVISTVLQACLPQHTSFISSELTSLQGSSISTQASLIKVKCPEIWITFLSVGYWACVVYLNGDNWESKLNISFSGLTLIFKELELFTETLKGLLALATDSLLRCIFLVSYNSRVNNLRAG